MQKNTDNVKVRPVFAAVVFGLIAALLLLLVALVIALSNSPRWTVLGSLSFLSPGVPCLYFALRGFRAQRRDAFEALPQRGCAAAATSFAVAAFVFGCVGGTWVFAWGPMLAAIAFALCVKPIREIAFTLVALLP